MKRLRIYLLIAAGIGIVSLTMAALCPSVASPQSSFFFTTGTPDGRIATTSHPESRGKIETESADDFILTSRTVLLEATFTGVLFQGGPGEIREVIVEIYRVFPKDSDTTRTPRVPTRTNSPSDDAFDVRSSSMPGELRFSVEVIDPHFEVANSVIEGINPLPDQHTGGEGPVAGQEVQLHVVFEKPFDLPADHYFFVPQVRLQGRGGNFLWLSTRHPQFTGDLQMWIRNGELDPDWLRVGTDIVGGTTFDGSFSLSGTIP